MPIESDDDAWDTAFHDVLRVVASRTS
jgi:hypothetical protein